MISNREKELQYNELIETAEREQEKSNINNALIAILAFVGFGVFFLLVSNRVKSQVNRVLKEQQDIIEERNKLLADLNDEKNELIKVLAHDLRSPLTNIQGCAMLLKDEKVSENAEAMIGHISQSSEKIQEMISKILDVDAIDSGRRNIQIESFDPAEIVKGVVANHQKRAEEKRINIRERLEKVNEIKADKFYYSQVIENLLSNAVKFSSVGGEVHIHLSETKDKVKLSIKDSGPGFAEKEKDKVFKKFQKLSAKPTGGENTVGLGLSIVKSYTDMMDGEVSFNTELGEGTEFFLSFSKA